MIEAGTHWLSMKRCLRWLKRATHIVSWANEPNLLIPAGKDLEP